MPYQDTPFNPAPYALSIGDSIARSGDAAARAAEMVAAAQARAAEIKGQAWAGAAKSIGSIPLKLQAMKDAAVDRQMKQEQLGMTVDARKQAATIKAVQGVGRVAAMSSDPESFLSNLEAQAGLVPAETLAHVRTQVQQAGPNGWRDLRSKYIGFADQFTEAVKMSAGDVFARPSVDPERGMVEVGRGPDKPKTREELAVLAAGGDVNAQKALEALRPPTTVGAAGGTVVSPNGAQTVVPPVQTAEQKETAAAQLQKIRAEIKKIDAELAGTIPLSPKDRAQLQIQRDRLAASGQGIEYEAIADAIENGNQPPEINTRSQYGMRVMGILAKRGYDYTGAAADWAGLKRWLGTANSTQQVRMRQAVDNAYHSLDVIEELGKKWDAGRFPVLNRVVLESAKNGVLGREAASLATQLEAQISDITSELGNVYMGGNSPTDHALQLAAKNLSADWDRAVLNDLVNLARKNLTIRQNSFKNVEAIGLGATNQYVKPDPAAPPTTHVPPKVGDPVTYGGKKYKVVAIKDGNATLEEVK